jgi:hypothetical protein
MRSSFRFWLCATVLACGSLCRAQERPYFVTYSDDLEEPGNLEISLKNTAGTPKYGNSFFGSTLELEYGAKGWWTTELYLSGQITSNDSTIFTGWRWENRFRPFSHQHFVNPILYVEYENTSLADRSFLEVTGHSSISDLRLSNDQARAEIEKSLELKLIVSRDAKGWNYSGNFISEKALNESEPWEFGYAAAVSRPLALAASAHECLFCRENFSGGAELYGGLGDLNGFGLKATAHYLGPTLGFNIPNGPSISFSPSFGLNGNSMGVLYRFNVSYEFSQISSWFGRRGR